MAAFLLGSAAAVVTSIDRINYNSNSEFFGGSPVITIGYVSDFSTDQIDVHIGKGELSQTILDGKTRQDVTLDVSSQNSYALYGVNDQPMRKIYNFKPISYDAGTKSEAEDWADSNCYQPGTGPFAYIDQHLTLFSGYDYKVYCVRTNGHWGQPAQLKSPTERWTTEWLLRADGETLQSATLSNGDFGGDSRAKLGDHAIIESSGALSLGNNPPEQSNSLALHNNQYPENWRIIDKGRYQTYNSYVENQLIDDIGKWGNGELSKATFGNTANSKSEQAKTPDDDTPLTDVTVVDSSFTGGQFKYDMSEELLFPRFTIYVEAGENGYVEVYKPVGQAQITSTSGATFGEFESGTVSATVKNVGEAEGSFTADISGCSSDHFSYDGTTKSFTLDQGASTTVDFRVSFSSGSMEQETVSGSCTVEVLNQEAESTTASIGVTGQQMNQCTPGKQYVKVENGNEVIYECTDGFTQQVVERCTDEDGDGTPQVAVRTDGEYSCQEQDEPVVIGKCETQIFGTAVTNPVCKLGNQFSSITGGISLGLFMLDLFVGLVAAAWGFSQGSTWIYGLLSESGVPALNSDPAKIATGLLIAGIAGVAVYSLFSSIVIKILILAVLAFWTWIQLQI